MSNTHGTFAVIGLGNFGATVAKELARFDNYVIGIDRDETKVAGLAETLDQALILDARDEEALRDAGLEDCTTALIAMGSSLEASVLATMNLKLIGVEDIWAKATSKTHHRILSRLGVSRVIHPEVDVGVQVAQMLHNPLVRDFVRLGNGYYVVNLTAPEELNGRKLAALKLGKFDLRCVGVMRGTDFLGRDGDDITLEQEDRIMLLGRRADLRAFTSSL
ncbi:TrkA family potassium uptake protein [Maribius pontilimi]|uniref:TrkA family potassium uptake protein n=1 Tax=Palleronia pontilimi TaxID=1964209 RepID=A0A934IJD5_9RHOB|nr:TrkA family potassium uptake protein [Palleronia pontilimi]MBJ3764082.1 TrkA family potassium uptake protein [Palleronia pontilimi]